MKTTVELGDMQDVLGEAKKHPANSYTVENENYFDYYTNLAEQMWIKQEDSMMHNGYFITRNLKEPTSETDHVLRTAFGNLRIWKIK